MSMIAVPNSVKRCEVGGDGVYGDDRLIPRQGDGRLVDVQHDVGSNAWLKTTVPDLIGAADASAAAATLSTADLMYREGVGVFHPTAPVDAVVGQWPEPGTLVYEGSWVRVYHSMGPEV